MYPTLYVTHVINFGPFLKIHGQTNREAVQQIETVLRHMHSELVSNSIKPGLHHINPKDVYLIQQTSKSFFRRCKALNVNRTGVVRVLLMDYGHELEVPVNQIHSIPNVPEEHMLMSMPGQVSDGILSGVYNNWDAMKLDAIRQQLVNTPVSYRCDEQIQYLSLISLSWNHGGDVSKSLVDQNFALPIKSEEQKSQINQSIANSVAKSSTTVPRTSKPPLEPPRQLHCNQLIHEPSPPPSSRGLIPGRPLHSGIANIGKQLIKNHISNNLPVGQRNVVPPNLSYQAKIFEPLTAPVAPVQFQKPTATRSYDSYTPALRSNTLMVGSQHLVYVAYIEDGPSLFSVHLKSAEHDLDQLMSELGNVPLTNLREKPSIGMACIARYSEDKNLYRAVIMNIKPSSCQVAYVDYGNSEDVDFANIYEIPTSFLKHPIFAMRFTLSGYKPFMPDTESMKKFFSTLVMEHELKMVVNPLDGPPFVQYCDLYLNDENIFERLVAATGERRSFAGPCELLENEMVLIRGIDSAQKFYVQQCRNMSSFDAMMQRLQVLGPIAPPLKHIEVGSVGTSFHKLDGSWCRVQVLNIQSSVLTIQYVDIGIVDEASFSDVKDIPDEILSLPVQAIECCLEGFESIENVSKLTVDQLELLADDDAGNPRKFKLYINEKRNGAATIVNLIEASTKPILDVSQRVFMMCMPPKLFRQYEQQRYQKIADRKSNIGPKDTSERFTSPNLDQIVNSTTLESDVSSPDSTQGSALRSAHNVTSSWDTTNASSPINTEVTTNSWKQDSAPQLNESTNWRSGLQNSANWDACKSQGDLNWRQNRSSTSPTGVRPSEGNVDTTPKRSSVNSRLVVQPAPVKCTDVINAEPEHDSSGHFSQSNSSAGSDDDFVLSSNGLVESTLVCGDAQPIDVCVSWWISPLKFYVQFAGKLSEYQSMMDQMQEFYRNRPTISSPPLVGSFVVCRKSDGRLYRSQIQNTRDNQFKIQCLDVGDKTTVTMNNIWPLEQRFAKLDQMAVQCTLSDVMLNYNAEHIDKIIARFLPPDAPNTATCSGKETANKHVVNLQVGNESLKQLLIRDGLVTAVPMDSYLPRLIGQTITITVTNSQLPDRFAAHLAGGDPNETYIFSAQNMDAGTAIHGRHLQVLIDQITDENILVVNPLQSEVPISNVPILSDQTQIEVIHIDSINSYFVQHIKYATVLAALLEELYDAYENKGDGEPLAAFPANTICVAKSSDGNWYRCRIEQSPASGSETVHVRYIDYGNIESIPTNMIRSLSPRFYVPSSLALKVYVTLQCIADESKVMEEISKRTHGFYLDLTVIEYFEGNWIVDIGSNNLSLVNVLTELNLVRKMSLDEVRSQIRKEKMGPLLLPASPKYRPATPQTSLSEPVVTEPQVVNTIAEVYEPVCGNQIEPKETDHHADENRTLAFMSHADRPDRFYLRLVSDVENLSSMTENIQIVAGCLPDLEEYTVGTQCIVKYSADESWYRAIIIDSGLNITSVQFIDYGNTDTITAPGMIKTMIDAFANIKPFAIPCALPLIPKDATDWSDASCELLRSFCDYEVSFEYLSTGDKCNLVRLWIPPNRDIMAELVHDGHASIVPFINSGQNGFISHTNSLSDFYIQMESDTNSLEIMSDYLVGIEQFPETTNFQINKICTAKFIEDDGWYRAKILDHSPDGTDVLFIDYGNTATARELRDLPKKIVDMPHLSKQCSLQMPPEIQLWSDEAEARFQEVSGQGATIFKVQLVQPSSKSSLVRLLLEGKDLSTELAALCDRFNASDMDTSAVMSSSMLGGSPPSAASDPIVVGGILFKVNTAGDFYVLPDAMNATSLAITEELFNANTFPALQVTQVGDLCVARPVNEDRYYRARVLSINSDDGHYLCSFIDHGFLAKSGDLREIPSDMRETPVTLEHYILNKIQDSSEKNVILTANVGSQCFVHIENDHVEPKVVRLFADESGLQEILQVKPLESNLSIVGDSIADISILASMNVGYVSYVNSSHDFWFQVQSTIVDDIVDLLIEAPTFPAVDCVQAGDVCAAKWDEDGQFYRARVVRVEEAGCVVTFIDYGNKANAVDLRKLPENLKNLPEMVAHCTLYKSTNTSSSISPLTEAQFKYLVDEGSPLHIQLIDINAKPNVVRVFRDALLNEEIRVVDYPITPSRVEDESHSFEEPSLAAVTNYVKEMVLNEDAPVIEGFLSWSVSSDNLYIQDKSRLAESDYRVEALLSAPAYGVLSDPIVGDICAAHFVDDDAFYRARILEIDTIGKNHTVFFVDYGNTCRSSDLRVLPDQLATAPDWAVQYSLLSSTASNAITENEFIELSSSLSEKCLYYRILNASQSPPLIRLYSDPTCTEEVLVNRTTGANSFCAQPPKTNVDSVVETVLEHALDSTETASMVSH